MWANPFTLDLIVISADLTLSVILLVVLLRWIVNCQTEDAADLEPRLGDATRPITPLQRPSFPLNVVVREGDVPQWSPR